MNKYSAHRTYYDGIAMDTEIVVIHVFIVHAPIISDLRASLNKRHQCMYQFHRQWT